MPHTDCALHNNEQLLSQSKETVVHLHFSLLFTQRQDNEARSAEAIIER